MKVTLLAGGTGAAKLAVGLQAELEPGHLAVVTNVADDVDSWGLRVCPDTDAVLFRLAGLFNEATGFGVAGDTFALLEMMRSLGEPAWFGLGDRDLAVHVLRTRMLREGARLSQTALELGRRLGVATRVVPVTDAPLRTFFATEAGRLGFQEYFVRERLEPRLQGIEFEGLPAEPSPEALAAVREADLVVIGPSNPLISIAPITAVIGAELDPARTVAVSPIVGGRSLKGPTVDMLRALGREATPRALAAEYLAFARGFVIDELDAAEAGPIADLGFRVRVTDTVMRDGAGARRLATVILEGMG